MFSSSFSQYQINHARERQFRGRTKMLIGNLATGWLLFVESFIRFKYKERL